MKRLVFARLLYQQGVDQSHLPEPLTLASILTLHDSVELFLILAGEHLNASLPAQIKFMQYWAELHPNKLKGGVELSAKVGLERLNRLRTALKHLGTLPGLAAVEQARADVTVFFEDNTPKVFGVPFADVDMSSLIPQIDIVNKIRAADTANARGDRIEAMALLVEAFDSLFDEYVDRHSFGSTPFSFGRRIIHPLRKETIHAVLGWRPRNQPNLDSPHDAKKLAEEFDTIREIAVASQNALRILVLGVDYREYHRFQQLTPAVYRTMDHQVHRQHEPDYAPSQEEFDYCKHFVITVALRVAEHRAHTIPPSWKAPNASA
jgi:hypothetical protein